MATLAADNCLFSFEIIRQITEKTEKIMKYYLGQMCAVLQYAFFPLSQIYACADEGLPGRMSVSVQKAS
jgi:hypothetical protein